MSIFDDYIVITIVGICIAVGYVIKTSLDFVQNKYIPLIMLVLGTAVNVAVHFPTLTADIILAGMISGLASTGGYEVIHQLIKERGN